MAEMEFSDDTEGGAPIVSVGLDDVPTDQLPQSETPYPKAMIPGLSTARKEAFTIWVGDWLQSLKSAHSAKQREWAIQEAQYRARPGLPKTEPYVGACSDIVPVSAMAVDPIHARLDTGIFKAEPVFRFKPLTKRTAKYTDSLETFVQFYQKHRLNLRQIASPRLLECTKHGLMVYKTIYDRETYSVMKYDKKWNPVKTEITRFKGPRVFGISINDFLFPPGYQHLQDCPIVFERQEVFYHDLMVQQKSGKLVNVEKVKDQTKVQKDEFQQERETSANHQTSDHGVSAKITVWEGWCDYDINDDGLPERVAFTFHEDSNEFLQIRYNWYFHQRKPYTAIPYSVANDSLYGVGIGEMCTFFQEAQTKWHQMATDNAYLANIRMFIAKRESGIEDVPKLYSGKTFFVDNPATDFIPFKAAEIYPSSLTERQNLFGLAEKRTGVSDYLTGRESPIVGSRATATSTVALIQEGTRRVEEVLENIRIGFAEIIENCIYIWIQYGLEGIEDLVFGDDKVATDLKEFFDMVDEDNVAGSLAVDLAATDAASNKSIQQQVQLAIIQTMMQYLNKLVEAGQLAIQAAQSGQTDLTGLINDVMKSARKMFTDLLTKYDIRNPEEYLPDLEKHLQSAVQGQPQPTGESPLDSAQASIPGISTIPFAPPEPRVPVPAIPGNGAFQ